jgi:alanine racemase
VEHGADEFGHRCLACARIAQEEHVVAVVVRSTTDSANILRSSGLTSILILAPLSTRLEMALFFNGGIKQKLPRCGAEYNRGMSDY